MRMITMSNFNLPVRGLPPSYLDEYIKKAYASYKYQLDSNFYKKLVSPKDYYECSRLWELFFCDVIHKHHKDKLLSVEPFDGKGGPDFKITINGTPILVECVTPQNADKVEDSVNKDIGEDNQKRLEIRISNSIINKKDQYEKWLKNGVIKGDEIFILAIGLYSQFIPIDLIMLFDYTRCLLPAGPFYNTIAYVNGELEVSNYYQFKKDNKKANHSLVNKNLFINQEYEFISSILFSKDLYDPKHFSDHSPKNDFHIYHNPLARNKCPTNLIASKEEYEISFECGMARLIPI